MRWLVVAVIFVVVFGVFTTVYAASAKRTEVRVLPKWLWVLMCLFIPVFGGLLYLTLGRPIAPGRPAPGRFAGKSKVVAPDDDPEFLRNLKRKLNEEKDAEAAADDHLNLDDVSAADENSQPEADENPEDGPKQS